MGARARHERGTGDERVSAKGGDQSLRTTGRNRRPACVHGIARSEMDDGYFCSHGRWRDQGYLDAMDGEQAMDPRSFLVDDAGELKIVGGNAYVRRALQAEQREREGISYANVSK